MRQSVEAGPSLAAMMAIGVMGNSVIYVMPLLIGAMVTDRGFSERQAGLIASPDLLGYTVATLAVAALVRRTNWRSIAWWGLVLMAGANVASPMIRGFEAISAARILSGVGGGLLAALATVAIGCRAEPDRGFGAMFAALLLFATAALWAFAERIGSAAGLSGQYIGYSLGVATLLSAVGAALVAWLGPRISRGLAVAAATLVQIGAFIWLGREYGASLFLILVVLLAIAWNIVNPFQLGILSQLDMSGSTLALAPAATGLGLAAGPAIGAAAASPGTYGALLSVCVVLAAMSAVLLRPPLRVLGKRLG